MVQGKDEGLEECGIEELYQRPQSRTLPQTEPGENLPALEKEGDFSSKYGLWDSYRDYGAAVQEANRLRKVGWKARITEAETPQGKRFRVWVYPARRKMEGHLPYSTTGDLA